jgi:hypothetical protein
MQWQKEVKSTIIIHKSQIIMNEEKEFTIKGSITEDDIPSSREHAKSKYDGIYCSCRTLERSEGIEVNMGAKSFRPVIVKGLKKRFPRRHFELTSRKRPDGYHLYIIRKR